MANTSRECFDAAFFPAMRFQTGRLVVLLPTHGHGSVVNCAAAEWYKNYKCSQGLRPLKA
jgi:hypothetical protein